MHIQYERELRGVNRRRQSFFPNRFPVRCFPTGVFSFSRDGVSGNGMNLIFLFFFYLECFCRPFDVETRYELIAMPESDSMKQMYIFILYFIVIYSNYVHIAYKVEAGLE